MRVLVHGCSGKKLGGIESFLLNMNAHMSDKCVFDYIIYDDKCIHENIITDKGGKIFYLTPIKKKPVKHICELWKLLGSYKSSSNVIYFNLFSMAHFVPVLMSKFRGYKIILHTHNNGLQNKNLPYKVLHLVGKALLRCGNYIRWTNSRLSSDFMFGKNVKSEHIYNAIDVKKFVCSEEIRERVRAENGAKGKYVIGFIGRLSCEKNPLFMLEVFGQVAQRRRNTVLWIIGEGELESEMKEKIEELGMASSVFWFGRRTDVPELLMGMDTFLLPSVFEGLGIVLIEAQATGLPCVTSDYVVPKETRVTDLLSFVQLNKDSCEWAEQLLNIYEIRKNDDRIQFNKIVEHSDFNIDFEAKRIESLFFDICRS